MSLMLNVTYAVVTDAECHIQALYGEYRYAKCHYAEIHYAERRYAECYYAERHYAECHYADCRGTKTSTCCCSTFIA
jgi:hypothetical protein